LFRSRDIAIVFDFDGTIAETERLGHRVAYNEAFAELGLPWRWDDALYARLLQIGGGKERLMSYFAEVDPEHAHDAAFAARVHLVKQKHFRRLAHSLPIRPGVARLVAEARAAGAALAIATTASLDSVRAVSDGSPALAEAFEVVASGDDVANKKPAPDVYQVALTRLGRTPERCIAIEDSALGLRSARAAGLLALVTPSSYTIDENFAGAAAVLDSLGEPDTPVVTLAGPPPPRGYVDLAYLTARLNAAMHEA
jgi:HAD superfamily hydrolase (TIGR01509 family)